MFTQKHALAIGSFISCLLFTQSSSAEPSFAKKYAPYIGYQHGYTTDDNWSRHSTSKYTPRFFMGMSPIQRENYKIGAEIGYTLPASYEYQSVHMWTGKLEETKSFIDIKNSDLYLTYYHRMTQNSHWFLKPGLEYCRTTYARSGTNFDYRSHTYNTIYLGAKAGAGYNLNNNLAVNLIVGSRLYHISHRYRIPIKFQFNINAEYAF